MKRFLKGTENLLGKSNGGIKEYFFEKFFLKKFADIKKSSTFASLSKGKPNMVTIVQSVRASDCGSECRGFESH